MPGLTLGHQGFPEALHALKAESFRGNLKNIKRETKEKILNSIRSLLFSTKMNFASLVRSVRSQLPSYSRSYTMKTSTDSSAPVEFNCTLIL